jgi:hypothetical protein
VRRVRRGLSGAHRARRQDRRPPSQPCSRGVAFPGRARRRVPGHGGPGQPVGSAGHGPPRLDEGAAIRGPDRGCGRRRRRARFARGPLLGRLRRGVRRAEQAGRPRVRLMPGRCGGAVRDPRPGGVVYG